MSAQKAGSSKADIQPYLYCIYLYVMVKSSPNILSQAVINTAITSNFFIAVNAIRLDMAHVNHAKDTGFAQSDEYGKIGQSKVHFRFNLHNGRSL